MDKDELFDMCNMIIEIHKEKYILLKDEIENIINNKIKGERYIERMFDEMLEILSFYETEETLQLYKKLCRYYYEINPEATVDYIKIYKEMTEPDESNDIIK